MEMRSFLAFELPPEIKSIIARVSGDLRKSSLDVKWVKVDNIHLTMVFMGNINIDDLQSIGAAVQNVCLEFSPFDASLNGVGFFPNSRHPRVLWVGLHGDLERMSAFRDALARCLNPFGIKEEKRPFKPHLTLGRFRKARRVDPQLDEGLLKHKDLMSPVCTLKELVLFKSDLKPTGAVYTKLQAFPLSGKKHKE